MIFTRSSVFFFFKSLMSSKSHLKCQLYVFVLTSSWYGCQRMYFVFAFFDNHITKKLIQIVLKIIDTFLVLIYNNISELHFLLLIIFSIFIAFKKYVIIFFSELIDFFNTLINSDIYDKYKFFFKKPKV